jgi:signal transduction histidine kinase
MELVKQERLATLGRLTATVSHELRNPLGAMSTSLYTLNKYVDSSNRTVTNILARLDRGISRCDHIIDELLGFAKNSALNLTPTAIDSWVASVIEEQTFPEGVTIHKDLNADNITVSVDIERLRRALINVVENGYQAMMQPDRENQVIENANLSISTSISEGRVNISVQDTGPGIEDAVLENIFEPLFSTKSFGVGLGMPTVKQILEQHKGGVEISTKPREGTTVTLWLPLQPEELAERIAH